MVVFAACHATRKPPPATYVDPGACAACHQDIAATYGRTGMGRSFARPSPENTPAAAYYHKPSDRYYQVYSRDGKYYQRRHQLGFEGRETNVVEKEIHYVMGSGNHARSYLHRTPRGAVVELPLGWYAERGGFWVMSPGYDRPDHQDFRRRITFDCMFCHNAYPKLPPGAGASGNESLFPEKLPEGIDCQRCHGPGSDHVRTGKAADILNPAKLTADRQMELCMQCHLETTSFRLPNSIQRYERDAFSYRPGEPLAGFILHFDHAPGAGYDDKFEIVHAAYRLRKSACFIQSNGALRCTTCHNPHKIPHGAEAARHYTSVCLGCHAQPHTTSNECLACHMPKRRTDDVIHAVMTDHYIQRRKPARDLLAPRRELRDSAYHGEVVPYYPPDPVSELYLAVAQVKQKTNLAAGLPRLEAAIAQQRPARPEFYFELAEAYEASGQSAKAISQYQEALRCRADFAPALRRLGRLQSDPAILSKLPKDPAALHDLGLIYIRQGKPDQALSALRNALRFDADLPETHNALGGVLWETGARREAEAAWREAIRLQPDLAEAHNNLAHGLAATGDFPQAQYHFRKAIDSNPDYAAARYNYGAALAAERRFDAAQAQLEAAVRLDPSLPEAHHTLGNLLARKGRVDAAISHYRQALQAHPDFPAAHLDLGLALAAQGRRSEALPHLKKATESPDAAIRQEAREALEK